MKLLSLRAGKFLSLLMVFGLIAASCSYKAQEISVHKASDAEMSCAQIIDEMSKLEKLRAEVISNKGLSGRNLAWALVFWPGIFVNEMNAKEALERIDKRMDVLHQLYKEKKCDKKLSR